MLLPFSSMESSFVTFFPSGVISLTHAYTYHVSHRAAYLTLPAMPCACVLGVRSDYSVTSSMTMLTKSS